MAYWIKINYERDKQTHIIDLERIGAFSLSWNGRVTLYLPNGEPLVITQQSDPDSYHKILDFVEKTTGFVIGH